MLLRRLTAYKRRMGWQFPYVSTYNTDFAFDYGLALTEEQAQKIPEIQETIDNPPSWLQEWSGQVGAELKDGMRENPSGSPSRAMTARCTTPTPCRRLTRSSRPTTASCSSERRKRNPPNPARGGRTNTRTETRRLRLLRAAAPACARHFVRIEPLWRLIKRHLDRMVTDQEKLRSRPQVCEIGAFSWQKVTGAPCSRPFTWYGTVRCVMSVGDAHIHATSDGV